MSILLEEYLFLTIPVAYGMYLILGCYLITRWHPEVANTRDDPGLGIVYLHFWPFVWLIDRIIVASRRRGARRMQV